MLAGLLAILALGGCGSATPPATEAAVVTPTRTAVPASPSPTVPPTPTWTPEPTSTATPTSTPSATPTATPTLTPTPLPGASLVAFQSTRDGNAEVYLLDTETGQATNLSRHPAEDRAPAWRPDGGAIAFESHRDGNWEIYVLDLAGGELARLTDDPAYDGAPAWSPDGQQIVFESYRDGNLEIYVLDADGQAPPQRLTDDDAGDYHPAWSPDGQEIAFTSWRDGNKEIYLVAAGGGEATNLSQHPADDEDPAWTPDGQALAFVSWRDEDPASGNRNAEIYWLPREGGPARRLTDNAWPDVDPAWDVEGRLVWAAYEPGPPFETYDPYRPGDYHLYRGTENGGAAERLTPADASTGNADDRRPAPAPARAVSPERLEAQLPPLPSPPPPDPTLAPGEMAQVVEVPGILASFSEQPILVNELVAPSLLAWQQDVLEASGRDFLHMTLGSWRSIDQVRKREMYVYDYGYLSWHKTGRALDLALEYKVDGRDQLLQVREDLGENTYWRLYLRAARQDGSQGEPLTEQPWLYWWHIVPSAEPEAYDAGGKRLPIPEGYYVDVTALAKRHGWQRIAAYAIEGDYHWSSDSNGTEYWHYERADGLVWWQAMQQLYDADTLQTYVGWQAGLERAQSKDMMRSKGVPTPGND
ncbi:MAG: TolB family protein [Anaerolineae bacterium]